MDINGVGADRGCQKLLHERPMDQECCRAKVVHTRMLLSFWIIKKRVEALVAPNCIVQLCDQPKLINQQGIILEDKEIGRPRVTPQHHSECGFVHIEQSPCPLEGAPTQFPHLCITHMDAQGAAAQRLLVNAHPLGLKRGP